MISFNTSSTVVVTCFKHFASVLSKEIAALGYGIQETFGTGVVLHGSLNDCIRLNLHLRCAVQVLYSLKQFNSQSADELYKNVYAINWEEILPVDGYFSVTGTVFTECIKNTMFANLKVKDAIADKIRDRKQSRPDCGAELSGAVVHLYWQEDEAEIFLDTSGESLSKHGYRKHPGSAPMLEALAAATVITANWDRKSPFINPMCGSGTLIIEAALLATHTPPGVFRMNYAFMHLLGYTSEYYDAEKVKLEQQIIPADRQIFVATDHDPKAIDIAKKNAIAAGVYDLIQFSVCDFEATAIPEDGKGIVFFNPEYGERLGDERELEAVYERMGNFLKHRCGGYFGYIFTANPNLAKKIGLKTKRKIPFYSGKLECRLLEFELYDGSRKMKSDSTTGDKL
jgi:putative N6-adenine-specific DNA methylase